MMIALALQILLLGLQPAQIQGARVPEGLGVNAHLQDFAPSQTDQMYSSGFRIVRTNLMWYEVERRLGGYNFSKSDVLADQMRQSGLRPMFILAGNRTGPNPAPKSEEEVEGFAAFAAASARHYAKYHPIWEIWNEPDHRFFWTPTPNADDYARLAVATAKAIRRADPDATIIAPGLATIKFDFLKTAFDAGLLDYIDDVSVHMYRGARPENAIPAYKQLSTFIQGYHPSHRVGIVCSEWGYPLTVQGMSEERQARYLARAYLIGLMCAVDATLIYEWNDDTPIAKAGAWGHFAVHAADGSARASLPALTRLTKELEGYSLTQSSESGGRYLLTFKKGTAIKVVGWTSDGDPSTDDEANRNPAGRPNASADSTVRGKSVRLDGMPRVVSAG